MYFSSEQIYKKAPTHSYGVFLLVFLYSSVGFMSSANSTAYTENKPTKKPWQLQAFDPGALSKRMCCRIKQKEIHKIMYFLMEIHTSEKHKTQQEINPS